MQLDAASYRTMKIGNTLQGNGIAVYYAPNGKKITLAEGEKTNLTWRAAFEEFCEMRIRGEEFCSDGSTAVRSGNNLQEFNTSGASLGSYTIIEGDAWNLR